jgi:hypothetical protein
VDLRTQSKAVTNPNGKQDGRNEYQETAQKKEALKPDGVIEPPW